MRKMKKFVCALLLCAVISPSAVLAAPETAQCPVPDVDGMYISLYDEEGFTLTDQDIEFVHYVIDEFKKRTKEINVENFEMNVARFKKIWSSYLFTAIQHDYPEMFYVMPVGGTYTYDNGKVTTVRVEDMYIEESEIERKQALIDAELSKILSLTDSSMSDAEKVLIVHDYITGNYEYDTRVYSEDESIRNSASRTLDTMVEEKTGVCQGYTYLFEYVMDALSIPCVSVPSNANSHIWNKVMLDGEWYNVDLTSDDPIYDMSSNISHNYFLINDNEIKQADVLLHQATLHSTWNDKKWDGSDIEVSAGTLYSDSVVRNQTRGQTVYNGKKWYVFSNDNKLCELDFDKNTLTPLYEASSDFRWRPYGQAGSYYQNRVSAIVYYNGHIYFNSPDSVYEFNTEDNSAKEFYVYAPETPDVSETYFYGLKAGENSLCAEFTEDLSQGIQKLIPFQAESCVSAISKNSETGEITVEFTRRADCEGTVNTYIAEYENNVLKRIYPEKITLSDSITPIKVTPDAQTDNIKVFVWDDDYFPICGVSQMSQE